MLSLPIGRISRRLARMMAISALMVLLAALMTARAEPPAPQGAAPAPPPPTTQPDRPIPAPRAGTPTTRPDRPAPAPSPFDPTTIKPFTEPMLYLDKYQTGLYPGGSNEVPTEHLAAGKRLAGTIQPLDADGRPDARNGRVIALVLGHSNTRDYFGAFSRHLAERADELDPRFELVSAAVGGNILPELRNFRGAVWRTADRLLSRPGRSPRQVQVLLLHTTAHRAGSSRWQPPGPFPQNMQEMQKGLAEVLAHAVAVYPNLKIAYLTSDGFRHFTRLEPHVWQEGFACKWLIESQITGEPGTTFQDADGAPRKLPWLQWGPYIWDNTWDRSYFTDGVHPGPKARDIFVRKYWDFLRADPVAQGWMFGATPTTAPD